MAGTLIDRQLAVRSSSRIQFTLATAEHDPAIRRLLRGNPMRGEVMLSFEREPNYFAGTQGAMGDDQTILAYDKGRLVCMGRCAVRPRYVNGKLRRVGYMSELRLDASAGGRFDILRRGYQFFHELHRDDPPDFYFTSIAGDNVRSIRFLERGLPGMPAYELLTEFVTVLVPVPRSNHAWQRLALAARVSLEGKGFNCATGTQQNAADVAALLNAQSSRHQLAGHWTEDDLRSLQRAGLGMGDFQIVSKNGKAAACAALWDQRCFRQTVIRGYGPRTSFARPWINLAARLFQRPGLPRAGSVLAHAFLSPVAVAEDQSDLLSGLIAMCLPMAAERGLEFVTLGFAASDPRLAVVRKHFPGREYISRVYRVKWRDAVNETIHGGAILPEVALL